MMLNEGSQMEKVTDVKCPEQASLQRQEVEQQCQGGGGERLLVGTGFI